MAHPGGRPEKLTPEQKLEVYKALASYIEDEDYPTIIGFCINHKIAKKYDVTRQNIESWEQFFALIKKAQDKQAEYTEVGAMRGKIHPTWAIFKLKQPAFGWRDRLETDVTSKGEAINGSSIDAAAINARLDALLGRGKAGADQPAGSQKPAQG